MTQRQSIARQFDETIPEFYSGRNVFVTGFSGFIGKVLVEKLLRCCPDVGNIYVLMRPKREKNFKNRVDEILKNVLFDTLRSTNKEVFKKIIAVEGNVAEIGLGMSDVDRKELIDRVSVVFHVAATVKFNTALKDAIFLNTRSTREVCQLAIEMKNIAIFVHVSTAYCQIGESHVEERTYKPRADWRKTIEIAEKLDSRQFNAIAAKYTEGFPNTYTFTKSLAENVVTDMCTGKIPTIIARPTVVVACQMDPIEGWCDNFNGPVALFVAMKKGIMRTFSCSEVKIDLIPVDELVRAMIKASWLNSCTDNNEIAVYNFSCNNLHDIDWALINKTADECVKEPIMNEVWHHSTYRTNSAFIFNLRLYLFQILPAFFVDLVLYLMQKKPMALKIQRQIVNGKEQLNYFNHTEFSFLNDKYLELDDHLLASDEQEFRMIYRELDFKKHFFAYTRIVAEVLLKEDLSDPEKLKRQQFRLACAHYVIKYTTYTIFLLFSFNHVLVPLFGCITNYIEKL